MSRATEAQQYLNAASNTLGETGPAFTNTSDPEELGSLAQAEASSVAAETLAAQASACESAAEQADLYRQANELALQAEALRQQVSDDLRARAGIAGQQEDAARDAQGQVIEAVAGTQAGDAIVTSVSGIADSAGEVKTALLGASEMATDRNQTDQCMGLIAESAQRSNEVAGRCQQVQQEIADYVGRL